MGPRCPEIYPSSPEQVAEFCEDASFDEIGLARTELYQQISYSYGAGGTDCYYRRSDGVLLGITKADDEPFCGNIFSTRAGEIPALGASAESALVSCADITVAFDSATPRASLPPLACRAGGPTPSIFATDDGHRIRGIGQSPTHVYWYTDDALYRRAKAGGDPEQIPGVELSGGSVQIDVSHAVWSSSGTLFALELDAPGATPVRLAEGASESAWTTFADKIYYMSDQTGALEAAPLAGGASDVLAEHHGATGPLVANGTGVYWYERDSRYRDDIQNFDSSILEYEFATGTVRQFAATTGDVHFLQSAGQRLLWADSESISSCFADSSQVENYTSGLSVRGLTSDGTSVYWASLDRGYFSELRFTPLTGGDWGLLGCNGGGFGAVVVDSVGSILVDADALYYQSDLGDVVGKVPRAEAP